MAKSWSSATFRIRPSKDDLREAAALVAAKLIAVREGQRCECGRLAEDAFRDAGGEIRAACRDCGTEIMARHAAEVARRTAKDPEHQARIRAARKAARESANEMARGIHRAGITVVAPTVGEAVSLLDAALKRRTRPGAES